MRIPVRYNQIARQIERGIAWAAVLVSFLLGSCSKNQGSNGQISDSFFPLSKGNSWVFLQLGSGSDSSFDQLTIRFDSVHVGLNGPEHWYYLQATSFLARGMWVRRDSVGDLWCTPGDLDSSLPFLMPSKNIGEKWEWQRLCVTPDTLRVSETGLTMYIPSGDWVRDICKISAKATCPKGDWELYIARGVGPVSWRCRGVIWDLLRSQNHDDAATAATGPSPGRALNSN